MDLKNDIEYIATEDSGYVSTSNRDSVVEFRDWATRFMKRFGIGQKLSRRFWGSRKTKQIRGMLYDTIDKDTKDGRVNQNKTKYQIYDDLKKDIKSKNHTDADFKRIARTETTDIKVVYQLISWKKAGIKKVKHNVNKQSVAKKTAGKRDILYNNRVFDIDYLLSKRGEKDRISLHPNCKCYYTPVFK